MGEPIDSIAKIFLSVLLATLFAIWRERRRDGEATHRATESAKNERKRTFRSFMVQFKSEAADRHHPPGTFAEFYQNKIPNLRHAAATIADDFSEARRVELERLISIAGGFTGEQVENRPLQIGIGVHATD